ncbi:MAG: hypothetical protein WA783_11505 [Phormidesmis sp.]
MSRTADDDFFAWFMRQPHIIFEALGDCIIEKPEQRGASPDKVLYLGAASPRWSPRESRRVNCGSGVCLIWCAK